MINKIKSDIIKELETGKYNVCIHGCNCFNNMGAGFAKTLADNYPEVLDADLFTEKGDAGKLGGYSVATIYPYGYEIKVVNLYTQFKYGPAKDNNFSIMHLKKGLETLIHNLDPNTSRIIMPYIGTGYGGGNRKEVFRLIETLFYDFDVTIISK